MKHPKLHTEEVFYLQRKKKFRAIGIVLMESATEIALGHNFRSDEVVDMTHIPKHAILSRRIVRVHE